MERPVGSIFKLMMVLILLLTVAGGGIAYWFFLRSDEMLRLEALRQLSVLAPELKFEIERANFDLSGRACLFGLSIQLPGDVEPALYIPETVATLDQQQMTDFENATVVRLRIVKPVLRAVRQTDGRWNWQGITLHRGDTPPPLPDIEIEHGTTYVELQRIGRNARKLKLNDLNLTALPAAARQLKVAMSARIDPAGPLNLTADFNLDGSPWKVDAKWKSFPVDDGLVQLMGDVSPTFDEHLQRARRLMAEIAATQVATVPLSSRPATASSAQRSPNPMRLESQITPQSTVPNFGLRCLCDLHVRLQQAEADAPLRFQTLTEFRSGQISNPLLPFPLYELRGTIYADDQQVVIRDLHTENGLTTIDLNAKLPVGQTPQVRLIATGIPIDEPLKARLPESARKLLNSLALTGVCDVDVSSREAATGLTWDADLKLRQATAAHEKFPIPVREVAGTIELREGTAYIDGKGKAGGVPVTLTGIVKNPGPEQDADFFIKVNDIALDAELLAACPPVMHKVLTELKLDGRGDVRFRAQRPAGFGNRFQLNLAVKLKDCSCAFTGFPYPISQLTGLVFWNGETVTFQELKGTHDGTTLTATGQFQRLPLPGRLDLSIQARDASFDRALEASLPPSLRMVWQEFQPQGRFDCESRITWIPGQPCEVALPSIHISDADIQLQSFPWPIQDLKGEMSYDAPVLSLKSFSARHDDTQLHGRGVATFAPDAPWHIRFDELFIDDLTPNATFRKALPSQLRQFCETLNPSGKFSISNARRAPVELFGPRMAGDNISANWDVQVILAGCALSAGVLVEDIHGKTDLKGNFDGQQTSLNGQLNLDSISVFRQPSGLAHQVTRVVGPLELKEGRLVLGSLAVAAPSSTPSAATPRIPLAERLSGDAIDGKVTLDGVVTFLDEPEYRVNVTLARGRLERYAQQYLRGQTGLAGVMNGSLNIWGRGESADKLQGRGYLKIAPAALYELPLFVQMFRALRLDMSDRKAFEQADILFNIATSRFNFETIDLIGSTISLRGRGYVRFDGAMKLDFYSSLARNQVRIPIIHEIAGMLSRGWVGVEVTGNVGAPQTRIVPIPELDNAMKQFLSTFDPNPKSINPPRATPLTGNKQDNQKQ